MIDRRSFGAPHDRRSDAGYGRTSLKNDVPRPYDNMFPYKTPPVFVEDDEDDPPYEIASAIQAKTDSPSRSHHLTRGRTDMRSFVKGSLMEDMTAVKGIVPFPFRKLYGNFMGHAVGGSDSRSGYTTAPGRLVGMTNFTNGRSVDVPQYQMNNIRDLMDTGNRALVRNRLRIRAVTESDF
jgi:hypothetical protein